MIPAVFSWRVTTKKRWRKWASVNILCRTTIRFPGAMCCGGCTTRCAPQGKLVRVVVGEIFDVAVDLRRSSATFGSWEGVTLSEANRQMLWIPPGLAHGFLVVSEVAHVVYKATEAYDAKAERTIQWNDPALGIDWRLAGPPTVSARDSLGTPFREAEVFE